jgi:DNA-binding transcriptional ArsR family regulator
MYDARMARTATTSDVFNAVGDAHRRDILQVLAAGEATVGDVVDRLGLAQPQVSKHLKVLRDVDLVRCRTEGRTRRYRVNRPAFEPLESWIEQLSRTINEHYDRLDDYLETLQLETLQLETLQLETRQLETRQLETRQSPDSSDSRKQH